MRTAVRGENVRRLSEQDRWLVIAYIKRFSDAFKDKGSVITPGKEVAAFPVSARTSPPLARRLPMGYRRRDLGASS